MTYQVLVKPSGFCFAVNEDESVLDAALRHGYFFPHQCRAGICGTCRGKIVQGKIHYNGKEILALTLAEQEEGYALFCSAQPESDLVIEVNDFGSIQLFSAKEFVYEMVKTELIGKDVTRIFLRPAGCPGVFYQAGQYLKILHSDGTVSPLSIANAPEENCSLELHLAHPAENQQAHDVLRFLAEEKKLIARAPYGNCTLSELYADQPIIFLARGTGLAPIKAIIEGMKKFKQYPRMHLYWSVTSPEEFYLHELVAAWTHELHGFSYTPVLSRPHTQWTGKTGLLQDAVLADYPNLENYRIYISAPEPIVHDVLHELQRAGIQRKYYYSDVFDYDPEA